MELFFKLEHLASAVLFHGSAIQMSKELIANSNWNFVIYSFVSPSPKILSIPRLFLLFFHTSKTKLNELGGEAASNRGTLLF